MSTKQKNETSKMNLFGPALALLLSLILMPALTPARAQAQGSHSDGGDSVVLLPSGELVIADPFVVEENRLRETKRSLAQSANSYQCQRRPRESDLWEVTFMAKPHCHSKSWHHSCFLIATEH